MFKNPANLLGFILLTTAVGITVISFFRQSLFKRQDAILIVVFLICGIVFFNQNRWYRKELLQFNLFLFASPAIFYTLDNIRLRNRKDKHQNR